MLEEHVRSSPPPGSREIVETLKATPSFKYEYD